MSGAHLNPAVSLAFALKRLFPVRWLVPYWGSEIVGVVVALLVRWLFGDAVRAGVSTQHVAGGTAVPLEIVLTWYVMRGEHNPAPGPWAPRTSNIVGLA